jgi:hypothetical protein
MQLVIEAARFMLDKFASEPDDPLPYPDKRKIQDCRAVTKAVLFPVRFIFTAETGQVGTNQQSVCHYYGRRSSAARELVAAAMRWRERGALESDAEVQPVLAKELGPLYCELTDVYESTLDRLEQFDLRLRVEEWRNRIRRRMQPIQA